MIAPVRETSAQTLGTLLKFMDTNGVESVVKVLLQLLGQQQWEVRHGSLLGFKYLLAVKQVGPFLYLQIYQAERQMEDI